MSDIRFNQWLHQSGTGGVSQDHIGNIGIGTTNPSIVVSAANTAVLNVGVITANNLFVNNAFNGDITGNVTGNISGATGTFSGNVDIADKIIHTGDTDTAMRFPADNTFAVDTAGTERLRISSNGQLLLGTTDAGINSGDNLTIADSGHCGLTIRSGTSSQGNIFFSDGTSGNSEYDGFIQYQQDTQSMLFGAGGGTERLRITSDGKVGINTNAATARLDISHPHTEQGLVVRSRYGNIATAMVKFDTDPNSNGGDGNVLHLHGGSSRTDSEILHIDSTGVGDIFDIRGDGLTRVYKQLQLEHSSNVAKIIFNEYGANDIKAQIEMDQVNGSAGQLIFRTQHGGTLSERLRITSDGKFGFGTSSPSSLLHGKVSSGGATLTLESTATSGEASVALKGKNSSGTTRTATIKYDNSDRYRIAVVSNISLDFETNDTGRMRLNSHGGLNVGGGVLSAGSQAGNIVVDEGIYINAYNGDYQIRANSAGGGSATLYIGNAAINTSSDRRLKENIVDTVVDAAEELKRVRVVDFTWNDPSDTSFNNRNARGTWTGVIAQELVNVFPFAVNAPRREEDLSIDQDSEKTWLVDQDQLVPVLIKAFQQSLSRIETLEARITALEG